MARGRGAAARHDPGTPDATAPIVKTESGPVRGVRHDGYRLFQGIPYAAPPVGSRRWRAPEPVAPWTDPLDATRPGGMSPQLATVYADVDSLSEDCLYLNVTTPDAATTEAPKPVMVWIHGGGGTNGAGDFFDPRRLVVDEDVVVVTFNYRLGIFGAFGYPGLEDGGTFGLLDQQAALQWVRRNAAAFGGDPERVTLFGESYGALSTSAQLLSPLAAGLFQRAAVQSSLALIDYPASTLMPGSEALPSMWLSAPELEAVGMYVAGELGISDTASGLEALRAVPIADLLPYSPIFTRFAYGNRVLPDDPLPALRNGDVHQVPVISGGTRDEARLYVGLFFALAGQPVTAQSYPELLRQAFGENAERVAVRYPLDAYETPDLAWSAVITDRVWALATMTQHQGLAKRVPAFAYQFADRAAPPLLDLPPGFDPGAYHMAEVAYQFMVGGREAPLTDAQWRLAERMNRYWANFARTGDPNGRGLPAWPSFANDDYVQSLAPGDGGIAPVDYAADHQLDFWSTLSA